MENDWMSFETWMNELNALTMDQMAVTSWDIEGAYEIKKMWEEGTPVEWAFEQVYSEWMNDRRDID